MRLHSTIALAAVAAVLALPVAAEAKVKHHAKHHGAAKAHEDGGLTTTEQLQMAQQQMAQMQAQLNQLQAKLDQSNTGAPAPAVVQAQASADAANAKADKALAVADSTKAAQVKTEKTVGLMKWAADTKISGRIYFNESNINQNVAGQKSLNNGTGFNIKRVYIGIDHKFNDMFSMNVTTDIANVTGAGSFGNTYSAGSTPVGKGLYIKKAYLEAKLDPALWVRVGAADLPWVPYAEGQYGYRHIENTLIDRINYGTSADWGVHVGGDLFNKLVSYQVSVVDGAGYRVVRVTKNVDVEGRLSAQYKGFYGAVGGYIGKRGNGYEQGATPVAPTTTFYTAKRFDAMAGYKAGPFNIGGEYFYAKDWNNVTVNPATTARSQDSAQGWSLFGNYNINPKWSVFGRYDWAQPNRINLPQVRDHYFNVGIQWEPVKIVDLALVYKRETVDNGALGTQNGTIGCSTGATANSFASAAIPATCAGNGTYDEIGLFGQVRF
jgi:hypothetical protein